MGRTPRDVTEAELELLKYLWENSAARIKEIAVAVYESDDPSTYATVKKLIERLEAKGYVERDRSESFHRFSASVSQDDLLSQRLEHLANELCEGAKLPLLMHLLKDSHLSVEDCAELRQFLNRAIRDRKKNF